MKFLQCHYRFATAVQPDPICKFVVLFVLCDVSLATFHVDSTWFDIKFRTSREDVTDYCKKKFVGMRLHAVMSGVVLLWLTQIRSLSYHIVSSRLSFFTQQHWHNNISEINRLNDCKYSEVRVEAGRKVIIILSETNWCNEALKTIFGKNVEKNWGSGRNVTAFTVPYSYSEPRNLRIKRVEDTYLDSATRAASKLGRIDLICCGRRVPLFESRIQKRSVYGNKLQKHHPFTVKVFGSKEILFTSTISVLLYAVFGICFLAAYLAYLSGIYTIHNATFIEQGQLKKEMSKQKCNTTGQVITTMC